MPIRQLPQSLVNRIAAGEVIERPASVVKELLENAMDAGATRISVDVEGGGLDLIRITDNGRGIPHDELPLALAPHATSKLTTDDDLLAIATFGFRGEALASIASVSKTRIISRTPDTDAGASIESDGGAVVGPSHAASNTGTTIEVARLFFNVPARRKFLKSPATEFGHIADTVLRLALPHPGVSFTLTHNGRQTLDLPATTPIDRLLSAWPDDYRNRHLPLNATEPVARLFGIIGLPELASTAPKHQYLFVNGRSVRDKFVQHALREAYRGLTEPGRHPAAVLLLHLAPGEVDVNVHPTKAEVRFRDSSSIYGLVHAAVRETLLANDLTPAAHARSSGFQRSASIFSPSSLPEPTANASDASTSAASDPSTQPRADLRQKLADFFRSPPPAAPPLPSVYSSAASAPVITQQPWSPPVSQPPAETQQEDVAQADDQPGQPAPASVPFASVPNSSVAPSSVKPSAIQLHNTYLVVESDEGMLIIDQHALHERILYEQLLSRLATGPLESQHMLIPLSFPATPTQVDLAEQLQPTFARLGVEVVPLGPKVLGISAFPSFLQKLDPIAFVTDALIKAESQPVLPAEEELLHVVLDMMACKAAVKAGDPLTPTEIETLLQGRHLIDRASNCPHGRPTTLRLTLRDLEKQFKRTGF